MPHKPEMAFFLLTAGGRISCKRCLAVSVRTKAQCLKPALKNSKTQKCQFHGGRSHTPEVLARISRAVTKHAQTTKQAKEQYRLDSALLRALEDALLVLALAHGPRTRGRKPRGYKPVRTQADLIRLFKEMPLRYVLPAS